MKRHTATCVMMFLCCAGLAAQTQPGVGSTGKKDPLDLAKTFRHYNRLEDEVRTRKLMEATRMELRTAEFREALRGYDNSPLLKLPLTYDQFITAHQTVFHALQVGIAGGQQKRVTLFGEVVDPDGKTVMDFEEPAPVLESKGDRFVERALLLPAKPAVATLGIAIGKEIIGLCRVTIGNEEAAAKATSVSRLLVSNNIYNLTAAQNPFEPFAFGGTKVVPKADRRFRRSDEVWLFTEVRNPAIAEDQAPRLTMRIEIDGNGKKVRHAPAPAEASPLKGVPSHYGVGTTIDIARLEPGQYQLKLTLTDTLTKQTYERAESIEIVE